MIMKSISFFVILYVFSVSSAQLLPNGKKNDDTEVISKMVAASAALDKFSGTECSFDCDRDKDCSPGLLCADQHERELIKAGLDKRKAYCGMVGERVEEVCYDPTKIIGPCNGKRCCFTRNFDDIDYSMGFVEMPPFYKGLNWVNIFSQYMEEIESEYTGYHYGETSPPKTIFNGWGETGTITALSPKRTFSIRSFMITPVFLDYVEMTATAYDSSNNVLGTLTKTLSTTKNPMLIKFGKQFQNIYAFTFSTVNMTHVAIDDMRICY